MRIAHPLVRRALPMACLAAALAPCSWAQLQVGTWSGTWLNSNGRNNGQERPVSIEVKMGADPHWRWRSDTREFLDGTFVAANPGVRAQIGDVSLKDNVLTFSFLMEDNKVSCQLALDAEGAYKGDCLATATSLKRTVTLSPPEQSPEQ